MFPQVFVHTGVSVQGVSVQRRVSVQEVSVQEGVCPGGLCPEGVSVKEVSVQEGLCAEGLCPEGVSVKEVSVQEGLCPGGLCPGRSLSGRLRIWLRAADTPYWNAFLFHRHRCIHGGGGRVWQGGHAWQGACVAVKTRTEATGTHPTGMHSCLHRLISF